MLKNYHTHTYRCHHALNTDEEYVQTAVECGFSVLGFSDHAPYIYPDGYVSDYKMTPGEAPEYCESILSLKEKYKDKIDVKLGLEAEYYPELFSNTLDFWRSLPFDYIILGQHFAGQEYEIGEGRMNSGKPSDSEEKLIKYTDLVVDAVKTGIFTYVCHPDLINYTGSDREAFRREMRRIAVAAKEEGVPLEINLLGIRGGRHYPCEDFLRILGEEGTPAIIGFDAHSTPDLKNMQAYEVALHAVDKYGIKLQDSLELRPVSPTRKL